VYLLGAPARRGAAVLAISDFDGVTRHHQELARRASSQAARLGARAVALLFWPGAAPLGRALTALDERLALLREWGQLDEIAVLPVLADGGGVQSLSDLVSAWYDVRAVVADEAPDAPEAEPSTLWRQATAPGVWRGLPVESSRMPAEERGLAELIAAGEVERAARLLGHLFAVGGPVIAGDRRGRLLGFPTANLRPDPQKVLPANGVYVARVRLPGEAAARHPAVVNIGVRPTFGEGHAALIEAHLLDATLDLYGLPLGVEFVARLRGEQRFSGVEALVAQIRADAQRARELLTSGKNGNAGSPTAGK
jgi:riboflavin kinase/FMN adenylyltransferase